MSERIDHGQEARKHIGWAHDWQEREGDTEATGIATALQASFQEDLKRINATTYRLFNPRFKENHAARGSAFRTRNNTRHEHFY